MKRTVQSIDGDGGRIDAFGKLRTDRGDQRLVVAGQVKRREYQIKRRVLRLGIFATERLDPAPEAVNAFKRAVNDQALFDPQAAIIRAQRDVHQKIEDPETLAAFWRPPDDDKAGARDQAFDEIDGGRRHQNVAELRKREARLSVRAVVRLGVLSVSAVVRLGVGRPVGRRGEGLVVAHTRRLSARASAKSLPIFERLMITSRPASYQRRAHCSTAASASGSARIVRQSTPPRTGKAAIAPLDPRHHIGLRPSIRPAMPVSTPSQTCNPFVTFSSASNLIAAFAASPRNLGLPTFSACGVRRRQDTAASSSVRISRKAQIMTGTRIISPLSSSQGQRG